MNSAMDIYIELLKSLVSVPSLSQNEEEAAGVIRQFLIDSKVKFDSKANNTWVRNRNWRDGLPVIL